jgi:hypothetical protein
MCLLTAHFYVEEFKVMLRRFPGILSGDEGAEEHAYIHLSKRGCALYLFYMGIGLYSLSFS